MITARRSRFVLPVRYVLRCASVLAVAAPAVAQDPIPGTWEYLGGPAVSHGPVLPGEIAADGNGAVYVSFKAMDTGPKLTAVLRWDAGAAAWRTAGRQASVGNAWYNALAFDSQERPLLVHRDYALGGRFNVRALRDQRWLDLGQPTAFGEAHYTRLAVGRADTPMVVYQDRGATPPDSTSVQFLSPVDGVWRYLGARGFSGAPADYQSIAVNGQGRVFVAFADHAFAGRVSVFRYDAPHWTPIGGRGEASHLRGHNVTLAVDSVGRVHVAYRYWTHDVFVRRFEGGQWVDVGITSASAGDRPTLETEHWRQWLTLAFDSQDRPHVAYQLFETRRPVVRRLEPATGRWRSLGQVAFVDTTADYLTLAIAAGDTPVVAFRDAAHGERLSVMRFLAAE